MLATLEGMTDSKQLSESERESLYRELESLADQGYIRYAIEVQHAEQIDALGIRAANMMAMESAILRLVSPNIPTEISIDGADNFEFPHLTAHYDFARKKHMKSPKIPTLTDISETTLSVRFIIGGDAKCSIISAASILAKVTRDRMMKRFSEEFPEYGFAAHKGYGTRAHREAILNYGITFLHRKTYEPMKTLISRDT